MRLLGYLAGPLRFARRRPLRTGLYLVAILLLCTALTAAGVILWFSRHLTSARVELTRGHNVPALRHLQSCQRVWPGHPEVMLLSARVARRSGAWDESEALLNLFAERHGETDALVLERLLLQATRGELATVGPGLANRIRQGGPDATLAREALVTGLIYRFHWAEAGRELDNWLGAEPESTAGLLLRGKLEEQRLNTTGAREKYRFILRLDPEHDEARLRLTTILLNDRHGEEALEHLAVLREHLPENPEVAVQWVRALALVGRTAESRAALDQCLREHPNYPAALAERGGTALLDGDEATAEDFLARAISLEPGNLVVRKQYAFALARNGKTEAAAREQAASDSLSADLERISGLIAGPLQTRPKDPAVHHEIAQIALRSGQIREAIRWFESALQADPDHSETHRSLANLYRELENPILAARHRALAQKAGGPPNP